MKIKIENVILDFSLYPRTEISETHVRRMADVLESGKKLPAITIQKNSNRVIDGFHRVKAYSLLKFNDIEADTVDCDDVEAYKLAVSANSSHGRSFTPYDYRKIVFRFEELGITRDSAADILNVRVEKIDKIRSDFAIGHNGKPLALKRTINYMKGKKLTKRQQEANEKLGGMPALFWVNQLIELLEADLWEIDNERLNNRMDRLAELWEKMKVKI